MYVTHQCYEEILMEINSTVYNFCRNIFIFGRVEDSRVGEWCRESMRGRPSSWILLLIINWIYADMNFSY